VGLLRRKSKSKIKSENQKPVAFKTFGFSVCFALFNVRSEHFQQAPQGARSMLFTHRQTCPVFGKIIFLEPKIKSE
tara:strand:- start:367 stop:594 length:228 start_codon:yes stop_codon:yes gene_type:complete